MKKTIEVIGKSQDATSFSEAFNAVRMSVFLNIVPDSTIDILFVFDNMINDIIQYIQPTTVIFLFDSSISIGVGEIYPCKLISPLTFSLIDENQQLSRNFHFAFGYIALAKIKISFKDDSAFFFNSVYASKTNIKKAKPTENKVVVRDPKNSTFHLIIALDCTASMAIQITNIKNTLRSVINTIKKEHPKVLISFYAFRDYTDKDVIKKVIFQENVYTIIDAISQERATGGGDKAEAHKTCLYEIYKDITSSQIENLISVCIFITDAPPHIAYEPTSPEAIMEREALKDNQIASDWITLARNLGHIGCQVYTFFSKINDDIKPMAIMSKYTKGLCFYIQDNQEAFQKQTLAIIGGLVTQGKDPIIVDGIRLYSTSDKAEEEETIKKITLNQTIDKQKIQTAVMLSGQLMRLDPSSRAAKRVTITSSELIESGKVAIKALKALYKLCQGNPAGYEFFDSIKGNNVLKKIGEELKKDTPNPTWFTSSTIECICSASTYTDAFEALLEFDEDSKCTDILSIFSMIGNFVIGYPFLFELNPTGKFNMEDAWAINLKSISTSYTLSISSLYDILIHSGTQEAIGKFRDLMVRNQKSGIVPICIPGDLLGVYVTKILDATKWLDSLVSYGLHRNIEPLPSITRATCCDFIVKICRSSFKEGKITPNQRESITNILFMMESMVSLGCKDIMKAFKEAFQNEVIPYDAFSPQAPYNCSSLIKLLNVIIQLKNDIQNLNEDYAQKLFHYFIYEGIAMLAPSIKETKFDSLLKVIFGDIEVDVNDVENMNPLESSNYRVFDNVHFNVKTFTQSSIIRLSVHLFKTIWSFFRPNEKFIVPSDVELTAAYAQALVMFPRVSKYKINDSSNEPTTILIPKFNLENPQKSLQVVMHIYFRKTKLEDLLTLQENRRVYLKNMIISDLIIAFRNCDFEEFYNILMQGNQLDWMRKPFLLDMTDCQDIFNRILDEVKKPEPYGDEFYFNILNLLALGESGSHVWQKLKSFRNDSTVREYTNRFLPDNNAVLNFYKMNSQRKTVNRHGHNKYTCPNSDMYTELYARRRIICTIAQFYFLPDLPHHVSPIKPKIIWALSKKINAPPKEEIMELANQIYEEMKSFEDY
ncbi:VWA domain-containing protein [Histomonas meleagridis]|uniref:VWA domain-containing protein n=1 Tax=Histomonas meleagridis TaxID=135588 RepID=UPI00355A9DE9|nr:VWA domain-containing protein [Histomonas meleagridis]KAH0802690.1 VWA domain-containing protein [Histomonas meleagridis]